MKYRIATLNLSMSLLCCFCSFIVFYKVLQCFTHRFDPILVGQLGMSWCLVLDQLERSVDGPTWYTEVAAGWLLLHMLDPLRLQQSAPNLRCRKMRTVQLLPPLQYLGKSHLVGPTGTQCDWLLPVAQQLSIAIGWSPNIQLSLSGKTSAARSKKWRGVSAAKLAAFFGGPAAPFMTVEPLGWTVAEPKLAEPVWPMLAVGSNFWRSKY